MSTLAWERVGTRFFKSLEGPLPRWEVEISTQTAVSSLCGGIIVFYPRKDVLVRTSLNETISKPQMHIVAANGAKLGQITLDFGSVLDVGISMDETIVVATDTGIVRHYSDFGKNYIQFKVDDPISQIKMGKTDYMALSSPPQGDSYLVHVRGLNSVSPRIKPVKFEGRIKLWTPLPSSNQQGTFIGVFVVDFDGCGHYVDMLKQHHRQVYEDLPNTHLALSPNKKCMALLNSSKLVLVPTNLSTVQTFNHTCDFSSVGWVGDDAIYTQSDPASIDIHIWDTGLESANLILDDDSILLPEPDGVRAISQSGHSLILEIPRPVVQTLKLGSVDPPAILLSCVDFLDAKSPRAVQIVKSFDNEVFENAINACLATAEFEFDVKLQRRALKAVSFAKVENELFNSQKYVDCINNLRISNALRGLNPPIFISTSQLLSLGVVNLLKRLQGRELWPEAIDVARICLAPLEPIYSAWGTKYIQDNPSMSNEELLENLTTKLDRFSAMSYTNMVHKAIEEGRQALALSLLERHPVIQDRVMLLLDMNHPQRAIVEATSSGNIYLLDYVLLLLAKQVEMPQLMRLIGNNPLAIKRQQLIMQLRNDPAEVSEFLHNMDQRETSLWIEFDSIWKSNLDESAASLLNNLEKKFLSLGTSDPVHSSEGRACSEWADLLDAQIKLEEELDTKFAGKSAVETLKLLLAGGNTKQAYRLRGKLGISERQFWHIQLAVLVDQREWTKLWALATSKKSPIGYKPFYDSCLRAANLELASKFVEMLDVSLEEKVELYLKTESDNLARECAIKSKNPESLRLVGLN